MGAVDISMLLGSKIMQRERKITILRGNDNSGVVLGRVSPPSSDTEIRSTEDASSSSTSQASNGTNSSSETKIDIIAPAGKLGLIIESHPEGGLAYVGKIKKDSQPAVRDKIHVGDKIVAIDDEDVSKMGAVDISMLLGSKIMQRERKITILRGNDNSGVVLGRVSPPSSDTEIRSTEDASSSSTSQAKNDTTNSSETKIDIIAPPGKLGLIIDSHPEGGLSQVIGIKDGSTMMGKLYLGDKVIAVDDEDVSKKKSADISMLLGIKSRQARKITILRERKGTKEVEAIATAEAKRLDEEEETRFKAATTEATRPKEEDDEEAEAVGKKLMEGRVAEAKAAAKVVAEAIRLDEEKGKESQEAVAEAKRWKEVDNVEAALKSLIKEGKATVKTVANVEPREANAKAKLLKEDENKKARREAARARMLEAKAKRLAAAQAKGKDAAASATSTPMSQEE